MDNYQHTQKKRLLRQGIEQKVQVHCISYIEAYNCIPYVDIRSSHAREA